jgi:DNA-binding PadR family transcriptional regulator
VSNRYAVLGLLLERRGYGYELVQRLSERLGPAWQLTPSSVYAALDQLESGGLISPVPPDRPPEGIAERQKSRRVVYEITEAGRHVFAKWIIQPAHRQEPIRSELHLKLAFARPSDVDGLLSTLLHEERLLQMLTRDCEDLAVSDIRGCRAWEYRKASMVRGGAVARLQADLRWIATAREALLASVAGA